MLLYSVCVLLHNFLPGGAPNRARAAPPGLKVAQADHKEGEEKRRFPTPQVKGPAGRPGQQLRPKANLG